MLLSLLMAASMWFYVQRVLIPYQIADAAAHGRPRGTLSDLYPRWVGVRELLLHGKDPYSDEVTREIQIGYYGRVLDARRAEDPKDEQRFAYPVYVAFLLAPTVGLPFQVVQAIFRWTFAVLTALSVVLWLRFLRWRVSYATTTILVMLTLSSVPVVQGIKLQQLSVLVGGLIAICAGLLSAGQLFLAGILLAAATIKPQLALPLAGWLMLWAVSKWHERQALVWGFGATMIALLMGGEYLLPGWIGRFADGVLAYGRYTGAVSLLDFLASRTGGRLLALLLVLGTAVFCWRVKRKEVRHEAFVLALALVLAATVVIVPMVAPYNQVLLLPAILLILRSWRDLWRRSRLNRLVCTIALIIVLWPWVASLGTVLASVVLPASQVQKAWAVPLWTSIAIPLVVLPLLVSVIAMRLGRSSPSSADSTPAEFAIDPSQ